MQDENFAEAVLKVIRSNAFDIRKFLFNDDSVSRADYDEVKRQLQEAFTSIKELNDIKTRLQNSIKELTDTKTRLQNDIADLRRQNSDLSNTVDNQREKLNSLNESLQQSNDKLTEQTNKIAVLSKELNRYAETYSELDRAYSAYNKLSEQTKFSLAGIFGTSNSPTAFLTGALQTDNLQSFFDYIADTINRNVNPDEFETLRDLFNFAFNAINSGRRDKIYSRIDIQPGDDFDRDIMRKTSDSLQSGTVKKILLDGYKHIHTDKVIARSLVSLE